MSCFFLFSSEKSENRRVETGSAREDRGWGRVGSSGRGEVVGKWGRRVNTHACKGKNDTC
jgi:hypothetical protein